MSELVFEHSGSWALSLQLDSAGGSGRSIHDGIMAQFARNLAKTAPTPVNVAAVTHGKPPLATIWHVPRLI